MAKSDAYLISEVEKQTYNFGPLVFGKLVESSFVSIDAANDFVNRPLERNVSQVDAVASGASEQEVIIQRFGYSTGKQAYRPTATDDVYIRDAYEVTTVLRHDTRSPRGYRVFTSYPSNKNVK